MNFWQRKKLRFSKRRIRSEQVLEVVKEAGYQAAEKENKKQSDYAKQVAEKKEMYVIWHAGFGLQSNCATSFIFQWGSVIGLPFPSF